MTILESTSDQKRDLARLIAGGYVQRKADVPGSTFALTAKGASFLSELGAGLNEA